MFRAHFKANDDKVDADDDVAADVDVHIVAFAFFPLASTSRSRSLSLSPSPHALKTLFALRVACQSPWPENNILFFLFFFCLLFHLFVVVPHPLLFISKLNVSHFIFATPLSYFLLFFLAFCFCHFIFYRFKVVKISILYIERSVRTN